MYEIVKGIMWWALVGVCISNIIASILMVSLNIPYKLYASDDNKTDETPETKSKRLFSLYVKPYNNYNVFVRGNHTNHLYLISLRHTTHNIVNRDTGRIYCIVSCHHDIPIYDTYLAQYLMIKYCEERFLQIAYTD